MSPFTPAPPAKKRGDTRTCGGVRALRVRTNVHTDDGGHGNIPSPWCRRGCAVRGSTCHTGPRWWVLRHTGCRRQHHLLTLRLHLHLCRLTRKCRNENEVSWKHAHSRRHRPQPSSRDPGETTGKPCSHGVLPLDCLGRDHQVSPRAHSDRRNLPENGGNVELEMTPSLRTTTTHNALGASKRHQSFPKHSQSDRPREVPATTHK